jgi:hypothetical protein
LNASANEAIYRGSAIYLRHHFSLSLHFCTIATNSPSNCLDFSFFISRSNISCLALTNNSCRSVGPWPGLIHIRSNLMLFNCLFFANAFDYFIGTFSGDPVNITFFNCVFDIQVINTTKEVRLLTTECAYTATVSLHVGSDRCPWPLATRRRLRSSSRTASPTEPLQSSAVAQPSKASRPLNGASIAGIVVACVFGIALLIVVLCKFRPSQGKKVVEPCPSQNVPSYTSSSRFI